MSLHRFVGALIGIGLLVVMVFYGGRASSAPPSGAWVAPFQPTRLDWLALTLQAEVGAPSAASPVEISFSADTHIEGISILIQGERGTSAAEFARRASRCLFRLQLAARGMKLPPPPVAIEVARAGVAPSTSYRCEVPTEGAFPSFDKTCRRVP